MTRWLDHKNPVILEAFHNLCQSLECEIRAGMSQLVHADYGNVGIGVDAEAELHDRKPLLQDGGTSMADDSPQTDWLATIHRLEQENAKLRCDLMEITLFKQHEAASVSSRSQSFPAATGATPYPSDGVNTDESELLKLKLRFRALHNNFKLAKDALDRKRHEIETSARLITFLQRKIKSAEEAHGILILDKEMSVPPLSNYSSLASGIEPSDLPPLPPPSSAREGQLLTEEDTLLQSTQGETEGETEELPFLQADDGATNVFIKHEPSSDVPVVVSERVVKRRKMDAGLTEVTEVRKVKVEPDDSSPTIMRGRPGLITQDSLDLDHIVQKMKTPRKRKDIGDPRLNEVAEQRMLSDTPTPLLHPDQHHSTSHSAPMRAMAADAASVLTPISGNKHLRRRAGGADETPSMKIGLSYGIRALAEDGGVYGKAASEVNPEGLVTPVSIAQGPLGGLLNTPYSETNRAISRSSPRPIPDPLKPRLGIPGRRELPFEKTTRQIERRNGGEITPKPRLGMPDERRKSREKSPQTSKNPVPVLRQKPLADLRLEDFKINPAANEGHNFAFSEVVRDKDDRAGLRGCTDLHCCGQKFRHLALSQRPNPPLTGAQRQEERKLLEEYLGDYSYRLASMTKEERDELWVEAKAEELANRFGRHRHRYSRMQSPPGFWNADFPDTQQLEAEKDEASKREKQVISERYREAMRPGGRWLFRDE